MGATGRSLPKGRQDLYKELMQLRLNEARNKKSPDFIVIKRTNKYQYMPEFVRRKEPDKFHLLFNVRDYKREEIKVRKIDKFVEVTCEHAEKPDRDGSFVTRRYVRRCPVPDGVKLQAMKTGLTSKGILSISAPMEEQDVPADSTVVEGAARERSAATPSGRLPLSVPDLVPTEGDDDKIVTICFRWDSKESKIHRNFMCITEDFSDLQKLVNDTAKQMEQQSLEDPGLNNNTVPTNMNLAAENANDGISKANLEPALPEISCEVMEQDGEASAPPEPE